MITALDFYHVMTGMVPLYVAMFLAYGSIRWWKVFTVDQCDGINRFVALICVPFLCFHFLCNSNPYTMNVKFIAADILQKCVILFLLTIWANFTKTGSLEWSITLFSLCTLPNTLVMGVPLLEGMYGAFTSSLMVQIVVFQSILWYTILILLCELRGAKLLISKQFPGKGNAISSISVDSDVVSLDGRQPLETDAQVKDDGSLHVRVRRSSFSHSDSSSKGFRTPAPSNRSSTQISRLDSSRNAMLRGSNFDKADLLGINRSFRASDAYGSTQRPLNSQYDVRMTKSYRLPARSSNFEMDVRMAMSQYFTPNLSNLEDGITRVCSQYFLARVSNSEDDLRRVRSQPFPATNYGELGGHSAIITNWGREGKSVLPPIFPEEDQENEGQTTELDKVGDGKPRASVMIKLIMITIFRKLIRNPNTYASLVGLVWSLISFRWNLKFPAIIEKSISIMSDAGIGMAMFSLGLFMALQPKMIACGKTKAAIGMVAKFLVGPAVMAATSFAVGLRGVLLQVAIVQAALPLGIVPFVFAKEYNFHADIQSTSIVFGMLVAVPIALVYYILLGL